MRRTTAGDWPLIGRAEELKLLREMRFSKPPLSVVINGPAGVGKSRLARSAMAEASDEGWATLTARGSAGLSGVPLGPLRGVLNVPGASELAELTDSVRTEIVSRRSAKGLLVLADDCQALDEYSAGLLHQLVAEGSIVLIATVRSGTRPHDALIDLWKDGLAERIELQSLSRAETTQLLSTALGGSVQDSSANRMWQAVAGNPLYLREVVLASLENGALKEVAGEWRWQGEWATGSRLQEIVASRCGRLDPDELTAMEMLSLAGSLPLDLVTRLTTDGAIARLEEGGLVTIEPSGRRLDVAVAHPLHAEVFRTQLPALQQRAIRRNLVDALRSTGARRSADQVRLVCWSLESGLDVDPMTLSLGAEASFFGISQAIAGRLNEILPGLASSASGDGPSVRTDHERAVRLARAAYARTGAVAEGAKLASILAWSGAPGPAEAVLTELAGRAEEMNDRLRLALALAWIGFWGRFDVTAATDVLMRAVETADAGAEPELVAGLYQELAGIALNTARPALALAYAERAAEAMACDLSLTPAASVAAASMAYLGRCADSVALVDRTVPIASETGEPLAVATLLFSRAGALARMGKLQDARELLEWMRDLALERVLVDAVALFGVLLGEILLRQGCPASAGRILRDSVGLLAERDLLGYRPWALTGLARARALTGDEDGAARALDEARDTQPIGRHYEMSRWLAEIAFHSIAGRSAAAVEAAGEAVAWAREAGMVIDEAIALDAWIRLEPSVALADRLAELVPTTDSDFVAVLAEHAHALVSSDSQALLAAAERFADMTAWGMAADAATSAATILDRRHQVRATQAAVRVASGYASRCEGSRRSSAQGLAGPTRLTKREREIAGLAAAGRSNKEIAERMYLSARTVENHLYHAYLKLGVVDREGLAGALSASATE
jgi:DNA-binding CsgD family transcriptional regulator